MNDLTKPPLRRRALSSGLASDEQAIKAGQDLAGMTAHSPMERLDVKAPLQKLYPSPDNPRRSLSSAGTGPELIEKLRLRPGEHLDAWRKRYVDFLHSLTEARRDEDESVWSELFDLAENIRKHGLVQPIVAQPSGEIIAGERRWTACMLAGVTHEQVIFRVIGDEQVHLFRLIENIKRADLSVAEVTHSVRRIASTLTSKPLGPDNDDINLPVIQDILGCKKTMGSQYLALCRLPDGDPMLAQILSGGYGGLRSAYEAISEYRKNQFAQEAQGQTTPDTPITNTSTPSGTAPSLPAAPLPPPLPPKAPAPRIKMPMPSKQSSGSLLLGAIRTIDSLPPSVVSSIDVALTGWDSASESVRKKMLTSTLEAVVQALDSASDEESA